MNKFTKWAALAGVALQMSSLVTRADEGMWLPIHLAKLNYADMQKAGLKLTAEQLYNINGSSLKDAVVSFGGFCTGEIISPEGLVLTNHHCGYGAIQSHTTLQNNYLRDGFWAYKKEDELPNPDLFVRFLVRMEDISQRVLAKVNDQMPEKERRAKIDEELRAIKAENEKNTGLYVEVKSYFDGNEYYMSLYETYNDVRLVGTPPESVGKFGGDTDNWMWPRHTGDFSLFRVYMSKDGKPAPYSKDNVPLRPKHFLPVSTSGVKEGDFTMIFGFPGRTNRFLSSYGVKMALDISNPSIVSIRDKKLKIMKEFMDADPAVRIKYASKYAQIANYWKYFIGQSQGLNRLDVVDKKLAEETAFQQWADADPVRKAKFGTVLADMAAVFEKKKAFEKSMVYIREAGLGVEIHQLAMPFDALLKIMKPADGSAPKKEEVDKMAADLKKDLGEHFKDYDLALDQKVFAAMMEMYRKEVPADQLPDVFANVVDKKYKGNIEAWTKDLYAKTMFASQAKMETFLTKPEVKVLENDPAFISALSFLNNFRMKVQPQTMPLDIELARCNRLYVNGTMQLMDGKKKFYPNANSTLRCTYGAVGAYKPRDAVFYDFKTTLDGIMEKEDPTNDEFIVPKGLKELYQKKDYGRWAENGSVPVGFIHNTDITGGNSGSPVINGNGELIGLAFDGNWEAMSGDIAFEPSLQRTISCDIRYVLFTIEKYGKAHNLISEMKLVSTPPPAPPVLEVVPPPVPAPPAAPAIQVKPKAVPMPKNKAAVKAKG